MIWSSFSGNEDAQSHQNFPSFFRRQNGKHDLHQGFRIQNPDGSQYIFNVDSKKFIKDHKRNLTVVLLLIGFLFVLSFLLMRYILKPIKMLTQSVQQVGSGNLEHRIAVKHKDELADLSLSFNEMTQKIREMIDSREQLLLDVSHELRSPITRIKVALEFLPDGEKKQSIKDDLLELEAMITEILETERLKQTHGSLEFKEHNLSALIRNVVEDFLENPPGINLMAFPDNIFIRMDYERIEMVIKNILDNASKYCRSDSKPIEIFLLQESEQVIIRIVDDGIGIPQEHIPYLFEPFYRIDKSRSRNTGGYGLGLSLCKRIMDYHNGSINIAQKDSGQGITVELTLPI